MLYSWGQLNVLTIEYLKIPVVEQLVFYDKTKPGIIAFFNSFYSNYITNYIRLNILYTGSFKWAFKPL